MQQRNLEIIDQIRGHKGTWENQEAAEIAWRWSVTSQTVKDYLGTAVALLQMAVINSYKWLHCRNLGPVHPYLLGLQWCQQREWPGLREVGNKKDNQSKTLLSYLSGQTLSSSLELSWWKKLLMSVGCKPCLTPQSQEEPYQGPKCKRNWRCFPLWKSIRRVWKATKITRKTKECKWQEVKKQGGQGKKKQLKQWGWWNKEKKNKKGKKKKKKRRHCRNGKCI